MQITCNKIIEMLEFNGILNGEKSSTGVKVGNLVLKNTGEAQTWIDVVSDNG